MLTSVKPQKFAHGAPSSPTKTRSRVSIFQFLPCMSMSHLVPGKSCSTSSHSSSPRSSQKPRSKNGEVSAGSTRETSPAGSMRTTHSDPLSAAQEDTLALNSSGVHSTPLPPSHDLSGGGSLSQYQGSLSPSPGFSPSGRRLGGGLRLPTPQPERRGFFGSPWRRVGSQTSFLNNDSQSECYHRSSQLGFP